MPSRYRRSGMVLVDCNFGILYEFFIRKKENPKISVRNCLSLLHFSPDSVYHNWILYRKIPY